MHNNCVVPCWMSKRFSRIAMASCKKSWHTDVVCLSDWKNVLVKVARVHLNFMFEDWIAKIRDETFWIVPILSLKFDANSVAKHKIHGTSQASVQIV